MEGPARMPSEPLAHFRMLVGGIIVDDGVDRLSGRHLRLDGVEEADELLVPVALHVAADDGAVEGFFAKLTRRRLKRGVFRSVDDLKAAIDRFVAETNADPKPFVWTAKPTRILAAVKRGKQALESIH